MEQFHCDALIALAVVVGLVIFVVVMVLFLWNYDNETIRDVVLPIWQVLGCLLGIGIFVTIVVGLCSAGGGVATLVVLAVIGLVAFCGIMIYRACHEEDRGGDNEGW
jgi:quinol-cytochrome oxidoreductase complex cytochrome b subunit